MDINGIIKNYYQNNVSTNKYNKSKAGAFYLQKQTEKESTSERVQQNASIQDIYTELKATRLYTQYGAGQEENTVSKDSSL